MGNVFNWFNIVFTWNPGASFSMFRALGEMAPVIIIFGTAVIIGMIFYYLFRRATKIEWLPLALIGGGAMILSGVIVLVGRFCERYGVVDEMYSIFLLNNALAIQGKGFVLAWGCRLLGFLNGALFLGMFIRSNRCLSILLLLIYFVFGLLLMLGTPPVVCLPNQTP